MEYSHVSGMVRKKRLFTMNNPSASRNLLAVSIILSVLVAIFVYYYSQLLEHLGVGVLYIAGQFYQDYSVVYDYIIALIWAICLGLSIFFWPVSHTDKKYLLIAWFAKIVVTLGLMLFYEANYSLDAFGYFQDSLFQGSLREFIDEIDPINSRSSRISFIAWLYHQIMPVSYHALKVSFAMIGLLAIYTCYRAAVIYLKCEKPRLLFLLTLFPGILFWSSIVGKDPVVFLGLSIYIYGTIGLLSTRSSKYIISILLGVFISAIIRPWLALITMSSLILTVFFKMKISMKKVLFIGTFVIITVISYSYFLEAMKLDMAFSLLESSEGFISGFEQTPGGSTRQLGTNFSSFSGIISFLFTGIFTILFRPFVGEIANVFGFIEGVQNFVILVLFLKVVKRTKWYELKDPVITWAIFYIVVWTIPNSVVTVNFGLVSRYKLQILPVFLCLLLHLSRKRNFIFNQAVKTSPLEGSL